MTTDHDYSRHGVTRPDTGCGTWELTPMGGEPELPLYSPLPPGSHGTHRRQTWDVSVLLLLMHFHQVEQASRCLEKLRKLDNIKKNLMEGNYSQVEEFVRDMSHIFQGPGVGGSPCFRFLFFPLSHSTLISCSWEILEFPSSNDKPI